MNFTWAQAQVYPGVATPLLDGFEESGDILDVKYTCLNFLSFALHLACIYSDA